MIYCTRTMVTKGSIHHQCLGVLCIKGKKENNLYSMHHIRRIILFIREAFIDMVIFQKNNPNKKSIEYLHINARADYLAHSAFSTYFPIGRTSSFEKTLKHSRFYNKNFFPSFISFHQSIKEVCLLKLMNSGTSNVG